MKSFITHDNCEHGKDRAKKRPVVFYCLCLAIIIIAGVAVWRNSRAIGGQLDEMKALQQQIDQARDYNSILQMQLEYMKTDEYYRSAARDQLGLLYKGEIRFVEKVK